MQLTSVHCLNWALLCGLQAKPKNVPLLISGRVHVQVLIRWSLQQGFIPLPKSSNAQRQKSNLDVFSFELSPQDMQAIPCSEPCSSTCKLTSCMTSGWCLVPWEAPV